MRTIKIGKSTSNDYVIGDNTVSRQHASVTILDDGRMTIKDLNSTNGTFVNGKRIGKHWTSWTRRHSATSSI